MTQHTPGPWFVSPDSATGGFVVCRKRNAPPSWHPYETLKASDGREACFLDRGRCTRGDLFHCRHRQGHRERIMRRDPQDWTFSSFDKRKHRSLEEARRRAGRRMWATVVACVLVPAVLVALVGRFL